MFPINLSIKWLIPFLIFSCGLVAVSLLWVFRETWGVEWKGYQKQEYAQMKADMEANLKILEDPQWGDPKKAALARNSLEYLKKPKYQVKQIILKGEGSWKKGTSGVRVDRCMTCHINEDKLIKQHPYTAEIFAFDIYGCTVCHEGNGRALKKVSAHEHILKKKADMYNRLVHPEDAVKFWKNLAGLDIRDGVDASDFRYFNVTGEPQVYVGSTTCIKCHKKLTAYHVDFWAGSKFKTFEKVKNAKDFMEGDENYRKQCYKCHTTGYNEKTGEYNEENVTCEACHGPGEVYVQFMSTGKLAEAATLTRATFSFRVCGNCHVPRNHEMRLPKLLAAEEKELSSPLREDVGATRRVTPAGPAPESVSGREEEGELNLAEEASVPDVFTLISFSHEEKGAPKATGEGLRPQEVGKGTPIPEVHRTQAEIGTKG